MFRNDQFQDACCWGGGGGGCFSYSKCFQRVIELKLMKTFIFFG